MSGSSRRPSDDHALPYSECECAAAIDVGTRRVQRGVDGERGGVHAAVALDDLALRVHEEQVGHADVAEAHAERVHPEVVEPLGVTGGDVPGDALLEAELAEEPEPGGQALLAVLALLLDGVELRQVPAFVAAGRSAIGWPCRSSVERRSSRVPSRRDGRSRAPAPSPSPLRVSVESAMHRRARPMDLGIELLPPPRRRRPRRRPHRPARAGEGDAPPRRRGEPPRLIPPTAADQAVATVRRFRLLADAAGADEILAKATSAIRRAANGGELVDRIRAETGVHVEVISGLEEARLIFGAVRASVVLDPAPALCFDLGGGSLEVMVGDARELMWATSLPLGVARLTAELRALRSDLQGATAARSARTSPTCSRPSPPRSRTFEPKLAVGSSGTLESLAEMVAARRDEDTPAVAEPAHHHARRVPRAAQGAPRRRKAADRLRIDGLDAAPGRPHRRRLDGPRDRDGAVRLRSAHDQRVGAARGHRARRGRPPRSRRLVRRPARDPRRARSLGLARRCNWAEAHARQVATLALELFDATASVHGLGDRRPRAARVRRAAARHRRARRQQRAPPARARTSCATASCAASRPTRSRCWRRIVRWHRRGEPRVTDEFPLLDADAIERVRVLAGILRVADGLDRSRNQNVYGLDAMITPSLVLLRLRDIDDAELEIWGARRKRALLEKVLDRELELTTHPSMR